MWNGTTMDTGYGNSIKIKKKKSFYHWNSNNLREHLQNATATTKTSVMELITIKLT